MKKLSQILNSEKKWIKGKYGIDSYGHTLDASKVRILGNKEVCQCCLDGALILRNETVCIKKDEEILAKIIREKYPNNYLDHDFSTIVNFNDHPDTNFEMIKEVISEFDKMTTN